MSKKQLIMDKSLELFAENGFEATSVQQITERCGISKGAFYLYFHSKDELIASLIDHFMGKMIADIEQMVINEKDGSNLLYRFLQVSLGEFQKHSNVAKLFFKEFPFSFNQDLLKRLEQYMAALNKLMLEIIKKQFPDTPARMHLDLLFTINGLIKSYSELFIIDHYPLDFELLCRSIIEKVTIIAENAKIGAINPIYLTLKDVPLQITKDEVLKKLEEGMEEAGEDPIIMESLALLKENLVSSRLNDAIVQGLLNNIRTIAPFKWTAYIYELYIRENEKKNGE